jgi:hypothetical protein
MAKMALNNPKEFQSMRRSLIAALLASIIASPAMAQGDAWPSRPITLMGGFPNGAGTDIYARRLAEPLSRALGQPVAAAAFAAQTLLAWVLRGLLVVRLGHPVVGAITHPIGALLVVALAFASWRAAAAGNLIWKGRAYGLPS